MTLVGSPASNDDFRSGACVQDGARQSDKKWWKEAVVYQIYPASFRDSNGDGFGDIRGAIDSLDHICHLGANTIWLSPIFQSPQVDLGYDISDYEEIHPPYGTVSDVEDLIAQCHLKGLRIILDLVINHTSDQHRWFIESRSSRDNPKADWYHWRDPKFGPNGERLPPNNWRANFGGSAWQWDDHRQQYYLHLFAPQMPDINWTSAPARQAIYDSAMRFWLDKGIDGFRIDTMTIYSKPLDFPDAPISEPGSQWQPGWPIYRNHPGSYEIHSDMYDQVWSKYGDLLLVGEYGNTSRIDLALRYCSAKEHRVSMGFQFESVCLGYELSRFNVQSWDVLDFKKPFAKWQQFISDTDGWTSSFFENHDLGRSISRFGNDDPRYREASGKMLAILAVTHSGTLFIYQGQEIGMVNAPKNWPLEEFKDVNTQRNWNEAVDRGASAEELAALRKTIGLVARDHGRLPMQWSSAPNAGFTGPGATPWMRVHDNYQQINVASQTDDPNSLFAFWRGLLDFRRAHVELCAYGSFRYIDPEDNATITFVKESDTHRALIVCNFTSDQQDWQLPEECKDLHLEICTIPEPDLKKLAPYEARIYV